MRIIIKYVDQHTKSFKYNTFEKMKIKQYDKIANLLIEDNNLKYLRLPENRFPKNLWILNINCKNILYLPELPNQLLLFNCNGCNLKSLPELPDSIEHLNCINNKLTKLPKLPNSLIFLNCNRNMIEKIDHLPKNIEKLLCSNNKISEIKNIPLKLKTLICNNNILTTLPKIKKSKLTNINCSYNKISILPELPKSLEVLNCNNCRLNRLPILPNNLIVLRCNNNINIDKIKNITKKLKYLNCSNTNIYDFEKTILKCDLIYNHDHLLLHLDDRNYMASNSFEIKNTPFEKKILKIFDRKQNKSDSIIFYKYDISSENNPVNLYYKFIDNYKKIYCDKIGDWFLDCKYNPKYKYCRDRLMKEYDELYSEYNEIFHNN